MTAVEQVSARVEACEALVEVLNDLVRDGRAIAHLVIDGMSDREWDELGGTHTGPLSKVERVGPHSIEYRRGES